ncbi:hypothetical protein H9Q69_012848 [Fusarium xylarioides]|nr:hypothetical protein H9Q70_014089 [Fusarium xylarioides]KAG5788083.1 hypothetical protein H9Q69_012848 [Fusarium xylarioides]
MDVSDISRAPPEYLDVAWIADTCKLLMGIGWTTNYIGMVYKSLQDETYAMSLMALCCNFAWELTYALMYPFGSDLEMYVHFSGLILNCGVMYTAVKNAHREWGHAPLVQRNLPLIFIICVAGFMSGHVALATQIGPSFSRFFGSLVLVPQDILRDKYWRADHEYIGFPLYIWFVTIFLILDGSYGICLWYVRRFERQTAAVHEKKI